MFLKDLALQFQEQLEGFVGSTDVKSVPNGVGLQFDW